MYQLIDGILTITVSDWCEAGLTRCMFEHDSKQKLLSIFRRGINGNTLIDVKSIKRPERIRAIEATFGKIDQEAPKSIFTMEIDTAARNYYLSYQLNGAKIAPAKIEEYVNRASILNGIKKGLQRQTIERAKQGKKVPMGEFYRIALGWYAEQAEKYPCTTINNVRSLERVFKAYLNNGYESIINKGLGNDFARLVSDRLEKLLLALWRTNDKPFVNRVHELYNEFLTGSRELYDESTGELFSPQDFYRNGKAIEISVATVWRYLKDVVNNTTIYADRNGNFDYVNRLRPKHHRKLGQYSLSKISMDDVCLSRKSVRGDIYRYIAVDVVSGYWFRPAYIVGKPNADTVLESFRNMFCELLELGLPMPGELEVEYHLMEHIDWLNKAFPFVRFCESPTEKRAEHNIKSLKYGVSKDNGHTRGRWYARHEAFRAVRNKVKGDFIEPQYQPQSIIADDLADIEEHNNSLHPLQKTYPGLTRRQVFLKQFNPKLQPIEKWYLYRFIGNQTETSIYNNDFCPVQHSHFELADYSSLKKLAPNTSAVTAYWLPNEKGGIDNVYLYQGDTYIGEAINNEQYDYNECAIERTEKDQANIEHQCRRVAKFDNFIKEQRAAIPRVGSYRTKEREDALTNEVEIIEETITADLVDDFENQQQDWSKLAIQHL